MVWAKGQSGKPYKLECPRFGRPTLPESDPRLREQEEAVAQVALTRGLERGARLLTLFPTGRICGPRANVCFRG